MNYYDKKYKSIQQKPTPSYVSQHQPTQEIIEVSDDSSDGSQASDSEVISNDYIIGSGGGYLENELFNILASFKVKFNTFNKTYGDDVGFNHINESHDIYQEAIDGILYLFENNFMCSE